MFSSRCREAGEDEDEDEGGEDASTTVRQQQCVIGLAVIVTLSALASRGYGLAHGYEYDKGWVPIKTWYYHIFPLSSIWCPTHVNMHGLVFGRFGSRINYRTITGYL